MGLIKHLHGKRVYFDTNIIIYLIEGLSEYQSIINEIQDLLSSSDCEAVTSALTICEALIMPFKMDSSEGISLYRSFLEESGVFDLMETSRDTFVQSAFVAGTTSMKTPDAIHVATALESKCDIFLTNDKKIKTPKNLEKILISEFI